MIITKNDGTMICKVYFINVKRDTLEVWITNDDTPLFLKSNEVSTIS